MVINDVNIIPNRQYCYDKANKSKDIVIFTVYWITLPRPSFELKQPFLCRITTVKMKDYEYPTTIKYHVSSRLWLQRIQQRIYRK